MNLLETFIKIGVQDDATGAVERVKATTIAAGELMAKGIEKAATGLVSFGKSAVQNFAEYEQLTGGVETLFGKSASAVTKYAEEAFKTSGLSANEYMNTVTSFSASLIQSVGGDTEKAANIADQAITDMADNANKMGTDISMIQNAYQGFAKQNYTMLDNLKLGYGGTKEEMERLLADAEKISGVEYDISSFADITEAIHVMQEEMGIAGATAAEAESTISGSAASMKAAWSNLVVGMADENANVGELLETFIASVQTFAGNLMPVIKNVLSNVGNVLAENGPELAVKGAEMLGNIIVGIVEAAPSLIAKVPEIVGAFVDAFEGKGPVFKEIGTMIVRGIWDGISALGSWLWDKVSGFFGGIVNGVKSELGIHSPSRVFAEIGGNMALGVGAGWSDEYGSVKNNIAKGLDFGTGSIGFASSALARSSAGIVGGIVGSNDKEVIINITTTLDGEVLARQMYAHNEREQLRRGTAFA